MAPLRAVRQLQSKPGLNCSPRGFQPPSTAEGWHLVRSHPNTPSLALSALGLAIQALMLLLGCIHAANPHENGFRSASFGSGGLWSSTLLPEGFLPDLVIILPAESPNVSSPYVGLIIRFSQSLAAILWSHPPPPSLLAQLCARHCLQCPCGRSVMLQTRAAMGTVTPALAPPALAQPRRRYTRRPGPTNQRHQNSTSRWSSVLSACAVDDSLCVCLPRGPAEHPAGRGHLRRACCQYTVRSALPAWIADTLPCLGPVTRR